jgi:hypothetical protein
MPKPHKEKGSLGFVQSRFQTSNRNVRRHVSCLEKRQGSNPGPFSHQGCATPALPKPYLSCKSTVLLLIGKTNVNI